MQRTLHNIAQPYPEKHKFRITLENAMPFLFTFLRYPGMPPHNNDAEREICDTVVLQRNVRHHLVNAEGMEVFSVLVSVARTCRKQGIFPHQAVKNLIKDSSWDIFKPLDKQKIPIAVAA